MQLICHDIQLFVAIHPAVREHARKSDSARVRSLASELETSISKDIRPREMTVRPGTLVSCRAINMSCSTVPN